MISWSFFLTHLIKIVIVIRTVSATSCCKQEQLSFGNTTDVVALHNCLSVLGVFNKCSFSLKLTVYFCFTAAFHLTAAGNSTAALFICCTPAVFPKAPLPQSSRQFNITCLNLSHFPPFNSPKVQGTHFSAEDILPKGSIQYFLSTAVLHLHGAGREEHPGHSRARSSSVTFVFLLYPLVSSESMFRERNIKMLPFASKTHPKQLFIAGLRHDRISAFILSRKSQSSSEEPQNNDNMAAHELPLKKLEKKTIEELDFQQH